MKEDHSKPGHRSAVVEKVDSAQLCRFCHQNPIAFNTGQHLIWPAAGALRPAALSAKVAGLTGKRKEALFTASEFLTQPPGHFLMFLPRSESFRQNGRIAHFGKRSKYQDMAVCKTCLPAFFHGPHCRRTGPAFSIPVAFTLADIANSLGKDQS